MISGTWTPEDVEFLKSNYPIKGRKFCSTQLNRNESSVQKKINRLGLGKIKLSKISKENSELREANRILKEATEVLKESKRSFWKRLFRIK
jgi:transposase-like protein